MRSRILCLVSLLAVVLVAAEKGWYPHEGGIMKYRVNIRFGEEPDTMPAGWKFGRVSAVATDSQNNVYVFHRGDKADPIVVFDADGKFLRSWGAGDMFGTEHGLRIDPDDNVWTTDIVTHQVKKFTREGKLLLTLGERGKAGNDANHFNRPTDIAFAPTGEVYISGALASVAV